MQKYGDILLGDPAGNSLYIQSADCVLELLPGDGQPAALPGGVLPRGLPPRAPGGIRASGSGIVCGERLAPVFWLIICPVYVAWQKAGALPGQP